MKDFSYALGLVIGHNLKGSGISAIDASEFAEAVKAVLENAQTRIDSRKAQQIVNERLMAMQEEAGRAARETGEAFLADNAKKEGVVTTESGLQYMVLTEGSGKHPAATDRVKCHYEGRLIDGTVFDSSYRRGEPATFPLNGVIAGWTEGLQLMGEGAKFRFFIPYNLAYGARGAGESIPPYAALVFDVELIEVQ